MTQSATVGPVAFKRYWLFSFSLFYPNGGMDDFTCDVDDLTAILAAHADWESRESCGYTEGHVYDSHERRICMKYDSAHGWKHV